MNQFLEAALSYAKMGWQVFPLAPGQKVPITKHGVKDATTDLAQIVAWWEKWPRANVAVACGVKSGIYVVDVDVKKAENINGHESLKEFPQLPETIKQNTPRGGFHAFYRSDVAPANRNSFRPGIDIRGNGYYVVLAPSIHPEGGQYSWVPGSSPWEIQPADYPDFMRPTTKAPWLAPTVTVGRDFSLTPDVLQRASLYLAQCDPAIQGQGGHDKLLWAAGAMTHGMGLTDSQAYDILAREYNPRCMPPWDLSNKADEKDFRRKVSESRKNPPQKPALWILSDDSYSPVESLAIMSSEEVKRLIVNSTSRRALVPTVSRAGDDEIRFLTQPTGLLGEICSWINSTSIKEQPLLSLACGLSFLGALFGRKVKDCTGNRTNLYCMGVAPSSAGKAHAMNQVRKLCEASNCLNLIGGDDIASDSSIEVRMSRVPSTLFLWDEIGHLLSHIKSGASKHHAQVVSTLMKLYSAAGNVYKGREYAEHEKQRTIIQPCCCIYGTSTPERFTDGISQKELQDGWLSRCLVFRSGDNPRKKRGRAEQPVPQGIIDKVSEWVNYPPIKNDGHSLGQFVTDKCKEPVPEQIVVQADATAEAVFIRFDDAANEYGDKDPKLACLWAKAEENARRIALIVACGESIHTPLITAATADYACRLVQCLLADFGAIIVPEIVTCDTESKKRKLYAAVKHSGVGGCCVRDLSRASRWASKKQRIELVDDMIEAGEIARGMIGKAVTYWTPENYLKYISKNGDQQ